MCGIFGIAGSNLTTKLLDTAVDTLRHRGPDDRDTVMFNDSVFLGHTRLSIIDLSTAGKQPMRNRDGTIWITYNGEIYNFLELRSKLEDKHRFQSRTDTEVALHLYENKGKRCVDDLNGMFAFAIYDRTKQRIFLARDRLGIKPLYYAFYNGTFVFSSEIKAILATGLFPREVDWQAIYDYFSFLYIPCPRTAFKGINQLPPGHYLVFDLKTKELKVEGYWNPWNYSQLIEQKPKYEDLKAELRTLLEDSVKRQLISDVPVGLFLSGGIDSTILTGLAAGYSSGRLKTFTVIFEGEGIKAHDDRKFAERVSQFFDTDHTEITVDVSSPEDVFNLISCFDQPFANPTFYLSHIISKITRGYVKVALSGAGGDELFGGYPRYKALRYAKILSMLPQALNKPISNLAQLMLENFDNPLPRRMKLLLRGVGQNLSEQYFRWTYYFSDEEKEQLLHPMFLRSGPTRPSTDIIRDYLNELSETETKLFNRIQYVDLKTFLANNILEYTDKTSMAVSLEVRVPILDHRVVELSFAIPHQYKIKGTETKKILKEAFEDLIPQENLLAPKRGFCPPIAVWVNKFFDSYFDKFLTQSYVQKQGVFDWNSIQYLRQQHKKRKRDNSMELFGIIMFDVWYKKYFSKDI